VKDLSAKRRTIHYQGEGKQLGCHRGKQDFGGARKKKPNLTNKEKETCGKTTPSCSRQCKSPRETSASAGKGTGFTGGIPD